MVKVKGKQTHKTPAYLLVLFRNANTEKQKPPMKILKEYTFSGLRRNKDLTVDGVTNMLKLLDRI